MNRKDRDRAHELSRRNLIKWSLATGAALSLPRWKVFEILESSGGVALAQAAACRKTNRSVHIVMGTGGLAWATQFYGFTSHANAGNGNVPHFSVGQIKRLKGTGGIDLVAGPDAPWQANPAAKLPTMFLAGTNQTHTQTPNSALTLPNGVSLPAAAAALQTTSPSLVPVIGVRGAGIGAAPGAPAAAAVGTAAQIVDLFDSAASRAGGLLSNAGDASLFSAQYQALLQMERAANVSPSKLSRATAASASSLVAQNLAAKLRPTAAQMDKYGIGAGTQTKVREVAEFLAIMANAFKEGLTQAGIISSFNDDPHGAFNDTTGSMNTIKSLSKALQAFTDDLNAADDSACPGKKVGDSIVMTISGDTYKSPTDKNGWGDGTPGNSSILYVYGNGYIKSGLFGDVNNNGQVVGWDPATGGTSTMTSAQLTVPAAKAALWAIAKGDERMVNDLAGPANVSGVVVKDLTGG